MLLGRTVPGQKRPKLLRLPIAKSATRGTGKIVPKGDAWQLMPRYNLSLAYCTVLIQTLRPSAQLYRHIPSASVVQCCDIAEKELELVGHDG
jgi:hypothetical protein